MAMNINESLNTLRPIYDFPLPYLEDDDGSRGVIYRSILSGSHVLDVGCDTGRFGQMLQTQKQCTVDGVEPYLPAVEVAQTRLNQVFVRAVDNEKSFEGLINYNAIVFLDVLEHLQNPWAVIKGAIAALQPGGTIHIVVPNIAHISVVRRLLQGKFEYSDCGTMDRTHLRWFTRGSLRQLLEQAGFEEVVIEIVAQVPHLRNKSSISKFLVKQFVRFFPEQTAGSIIGHAKKPDYSNLTK
jgi:2-polyprenyl-3-methyl-5-hydroxy-6-metoxy-1,4-benzoquinol methylase